MKFNYLQTKDRAQGMRFKRRHYFIDAAQWDGTEESFHTCCVALGLKKDAANAYITPAGFELYLAPPDGAFVLEMREGRMLLSPGDWVCRNVKNGVIFPCRADRFAERYEPVGATVDNGDPAVV